MPWRLLKAPTRGRLAIVDDDFLIRKDFNQAFDCKTGHQNQSLGSISINADQVKSSLARLTWPERLDRSETKKN